MPSRRAANRTRTPGGRVWSEGNALRDMCVAIALGLVFVVAMAVCLIVFSHTWAAGPVSASAR